MAYYFLNYFRVTGLLAYLGKNNDPNHLTTICSEFHSIHLSASEGEMCDSLFAGQVKVQEMLASNTIIILRLHWSNIN